MAGRPIGRRHQDDVRSKIQASQLVNRLTDHVNSKVELTASQVTAALGLLRKCVPDLSATELTAEVTHSYVAEIPAPSLNVEAWQQSVSGDRSQAPKPH
jgi:hypothetical protein